MLAFRADGLVTVTSGGTITAATRGYRGGAGGTRDNDMVAGWSGES